MVFNEAVFLQQLAQEEQARLSWLERKFRLYQPDIWSVEQLAKSYRGHVKDPNGKIVFQASVPLLLVPIIVFFLYTPISFLIKMLPVDLVSKRIISVVISISLAVLVIIFIKKKGSKIELSPAGIILPDQAYQWTDFFKAFILKKRQGKMYNYYLVLPLTSGGHERIKITNMVGSEFAAKRFSAYMEYYRAQRIK